VSGGEREISGLEGTDDRSRGEKGGAIRARSHSKKEREGMTMQEKDKVPCTLIHVTGRRGSFPPSMDLKRAAFAPEGRGKKKKRRTFSKGD